MEHESMSAEFFQSREEALVMLHELQAAAAVADDRFEVPPGGRCMTSTDAICKVSTIDVWAIAMGADWHIVEDGTVSLVPTDLREHLSMEILLTKQEVQRMIELRRRTAEQFPPGSAPLQMNRVAAGEDKPQIGQDSNLGRYDEEAS